MRRFLVVAVVMSAVLAVAVLARAGVSPAAYTCGSGGSCGSGSGSGPGCVPTSRYLSTAGRLYDVAGTSGSDVWAVGLESASSLIMHWDGSCWTVSPESPAGYLQAVSAVSADDAWAVGGTSWGNPSRTLAMHWDGTSWTRVATPVQGGSAIFAAVAATSAANAWAVGSIGPGPGVAASGSPLIEHWNGTAWSAQPFAVPVAGGQLVAVAATSADNAWAVGHTGDNRKSAGQATLIEHWNGTAWRRVHSPDPQGRGNFLQGVTAITADDAWAVGYTVTGSGVYHALTMHWDGSAWSVVTSPAGDINLRAVSASSADDVWAVGLTDECGHGGSRCTTVAMHWDGSNWTLTSTLNPASSSVDALLGVAAIGRDDVWAAGTVDWESTLIEHYDGSTWRD